MKAWRGFVFPANFFASLTFRVFSRGSHHFAFRSRTGKIFLVEAKTEAADMEDNTKVVLISNENGSIETSVKSVKLSITMKDMLETIGTTEGPEIPFDNINTRTLQKVVEWLNKNVDIKQPTGEEIKEKLADTISQWEQDFLEMPLMDLYDLIAAANFLNIPGLLWLTTRAVAYMIKGKSAEDVRALFNIPNDWTEAELEAIRIENQWCEEK